MPSSAIQDVHQPIAKEERKNTAKDMVGAGSSSQQDRLKILSYLIHPTQIDRNDFKNLTNNKAYEAYENEVKIKKEKPTEEAEKAEKAQKRIRKKKKKKKKERTL